jgi:hypothetical protein
LLPEQTGPVLPVTVEFRSGSKVFEHGEEQGTTPREPQWHVLQWWAVFVLAIDESRAAPSGGTSRTSGLRLLVCPGRSGSPVHRGHRGDGAMLGCASGRAEGSRRTP